MEVAVSVSSFSVHRVMKAAVVVLCYENVQKWESSVSSVSL